MKTVILAGGLGTRLSEVTDIIPKPMVKIGKYPIIYHVMNTFNKYGYKDFYVALGYKSEIIKNYFLNYKYETADFEINYKSNEINLINKPKIDWKISLIDTGLETMTGGRLKRLKGYFDKNEDFFLTYGDSLANVNLKKLLSFHKQHKKLVTISAVHPGARFGELKLSNYKVKSFKEKPQTQEGWINGGYMVINSKFLKYIKNDKSILEKNPLEIAAKNGELMAYKHEGFWHCMDTKRDKDNLEELYSKGPPWLL